MHFTSMAVVLSTLFAAPSGDCGDSGRGDVVTVAVLDLRPRGVDPRIADTLLDIITGEIARAPGHKVMSRKEMQAILSEEARRQLLGCDDTSCLAEIAGALNAGFVVGGEVAKLGDKHILTLQLINHRYATVVNRVALEWPGSPDVMPDVARAASQLLILERAQRKPGTLQVINAPGDAVAFLDGKPLPGMQADAVEVGVHELIVSASGRQDRTIPFVVQAGTEARVDGALQGVPIYRRPAFWGLGLVGVGAVATLVAMTVVGIPAAALVAVTGNASASGNTTSPSTRYR